MSETIPTFREGDRVRVMQTPQAERDGIANTRGIVLCTLESQVRGPMVVIDVDGRNALHVPASWVMRDELTVSAGASQ